MSCISGCAPCLPTASLRGKSEPICCHNPLPVVFALPVICLRASKKRVQASRMSDTDCARRHLGRLALTRGALTAKQGSAQAFPDESAARLDVVGLYPFNA